jgi:SulP family sulfate permease
LAQEVSFFNKASIIDTLDLILENSAVIIDFSKSKSIARCFEIIRDFEINAKTKNIDVEKIKYIAA